MFTKFFQWYENRHDYARDWLAKHDGEVVGCFCSYVPEELIYAAGLLPDGTAYTRKKVTVKPSAGSEYIRTAHTTNAKAIAKLQDQLNG